MSNFLISHDFNNLKKTSKLFVDIFATISYNIRKREGYEEEEDLDINKVKTGFEKYWKASTKYYLLECKDNAKLISVFQNGNKKLIGFLLYLLIQNTDKVYVEFICVEAKYQRMGIGSMMINKIFEIHKDVSNIYLRTERESNEKALNFYKKQGFKKVITAFDFIELCKERKKNL